MGSPESASQRLAVLAPLPAPEPLAVSAARALSCLLAAMAAWRDSSRCRSLSGTHGGIGTFADSSDSALGSIVWDSVWGRPTSRSNSCRHKYGQTVPEPNVSLRLSVFDRPVPQVLPIFRCRFPSVCGGFTARIWCWGGVCVLTHVRSLKSSAETDDFVSCRRFVACWLTVRICMRNDTRFKAFPGSQRSEL